MGSKWWSPDWIHDKGLRKLYFLLLLPLLSSSYQGFDGMIMNGLQILPSWQSSMSTHSKRLPSLQFVVLFNFY